MNPSPTGQPGTIREISIRPNLVNRRYVSVLVKFWADPGSIHEQGVQFAASPLGATAFLASLAVPDPQIFPGDPLAPSDLYPRAGHVFHTATYEDIKKLAERFGTRGPLYDDFLGGVGPIPTTTAQSTGQSAPQSQSAPTSESAPPSYSPPRDDVSGDDPAGVVSLADIPDGPQV